MKNGKAGKNDDDPTAMTSTNSGIDTHTLAQNKNKCILCIVMDYQGFLAIFLYVIKKGCICSYNVFQHNVHFRYIQLWLFVLRLLFLKGQTDENLNFDG